MGNDSLMGTGLFWGGDKNVLELVVMVAQHGKYTKTPELYTLKWLK